MSEPVVACLFLFALAYGFMLGTAVALDGKSPFWTGFMDVITLRIFWRLR